MPRRTSTSRCSSRDGLDDGAPDGAHRIPPRALSAARQVASGRDLEPVRDRGTHNARHLDHGCGVFVAGVVFDGTKVVVFTVAVGAAFALFWGAIPLIRGAFEGELQRADRPTKEKSRVTKLPIRHGSNPDSRLDGCRTSNHFTTRPDFEPSGARWAWPRRGVHAAGLARATASFSSRTRRRWTRAGSRQSRFWRLVRGGPLHRASASGCHYGPTTWTVAGIVAITLSIEAFGTPICNNELFYLFVAGFTFYYFRPFEASDTRFSASSPMAGPRRHIGRRGGDGRPLPLAG